MLAYKDSKVPANLRNVKFNTCQNCQCCPISKEEITGWWKRLIPSSQLAGTQPPSWYVQSHLCWFPQLSRGLFGKKNIQKRWEDFRLKSVEGLWPWTSWTLPNTKTQDLGFIVSLFLVYHNFYASPMWIFFDMKFLKKRLTHWRSCQEAWKVATKSPWETVSRKSSKVFQWSLLSSIPVPVTRRICKGGKYV